METCQLDIMTFFDWFTTYTLQNVHLIWVAVCTAICCCVVVAIAKLLGYERKKVAWVISLVNSGTMCLIGFTYFFVRKYLKDFSMVWNADDFLGIDNVSVICCTIFGVANISDILIGIIFYRDQLGLLTAWVHHTLYIWLMVYCTTGNGLFTTHAPFAQGFMWNVIEELPTFLLALGSIESKYRTDLGFGLSFFILRIVYHTLLTVYAITSTAYGISVICIYFLTLAMHVNWFSTWASKYGSKLFTKSDRKKV